MLRNNEHQFTKAFLLQPNVFGCFKSVCAQLFFFAVTFHSALLLFSPGLTILRKDKSTQISFSAQKKKKAWSFLKCVAPRWKAVNAKVTSSGSFTSWWFGQKASAGDLN